jgi:endonuclease/exonuclease/phosphatase family metal-dependent hydrolase
VSITIATWNIRRASLAKVAPIIDDLAPDVLVVQEIRRDDSAVDVLGASGVRWVGSDPATQLAVLTFGDFTLADGPNVDFEDELKWVLPVEVKGPASFHLLGVWADNENAFRPATAAIRHLDAWLADGPSVVAGDFNHHRKWDHQGYNERDHKVTSDLLARLGLVSAYHRSRERGESRLPVEEEPTFWMHFDELKAHHIDYVYAPFASIKERAADVNVASFDDIVNARISDHAPVVVTLSLEQGGDSPSQTHRPVRSASVSNEATNSESGRRRRGAFGRR